MDAKQPHRTIEFYKAEIVKKEEIIEKLFEEVDDLKENRQEYNKVIEKFKNETKRLTQDNHKKDQEIESLKTSYNEALGKIDYLGILLQDMQNNENNWKKREKDWIKQYDKLVELRSHLEKSL
jgi:chromosome segregation ATPase